MRKSLRSFLIAGLMSGGLLLAAPSVASAADLKNCSDFTSQAAAQANLNQTLPKDPNRLDANNNGAACETFDYGVSGPTTTSPIRDTTTTTGGTATTVSPTTTTASVGATPARFPTGPVATGFGGMADQSDGTTGGLPVVPLTLIGSGVAVIGFAGLRMRRA